MKSPLTLLSVTCLDAPLVAVSWQWLFARTFHTHIEVAARIVLFLTAWLIYLADRTADSLTIAAEGPASKRQKFCLQHRRLMLGLMMVILPVDIICALGALDAETFFFGAVIGVLILVYFLLNHLAPSVWKRFPLKEVSIGMLFALGCVVAVHERRVVFFVATVLFGVLCALNCLSISVWEQALDQAQRRVSFAMVYSHRTGVPELGCWLLAIGASSLVMNSHLRTIAMSIGSSALLLALVHRARRIARDERVALADLVLLTPLIFYSGGL